MGSGYYDSINGVVLTLSKHCIYDRDRRCLLGWGHIVNAMKTKVRSSSLFILCCGQYYNRATRVATIVTPVG